MSEMDMLERVARAICAENYGDPDGTYETPLGQRVSWHGFLPEAKAAIEAMREPTEAMTEAAREARIFVDEFQILETESEEIWKAMIAAALSPSREDGK